MAAARAAAARAAAAEEAAAAVPCRVGTAAAHLLKAEVEPPINSSEPSRFAWTSPADALGSCRAALAPWAES